uniref:Uncharacterized protein n=1 Tax=Echeneis naucrates TaxID=173247 RepID=A0A665TE54_ECHNA
LSTCMGMYGGMNYCTPVLTHGHYLIQHLTGSFSGTNYVIPSHFLTTIFLCCMFITLNFRYWSLNFSFSLQLFLSLLVSFLICKNKQVT